MRKKGKRKREEEEGKEKADWVNCKISGHSGLCLPLLLQPRAFPKLDEATNGPGFSMDDMD